MITREQIEEWRTYILGIEGLPEAEQTEFNALCDAALRAAAPAPDVAELVLRLRTFANCATTNEFDRKLILEAAEALGRLATLQADAERYRAVRACHGTTLRVGEQEFVGISNLDAWADAQIAARKAAP